MEIRQIRIGSGKQHLRVVAAQIRTREYLGQEGAVRDEAVIEKMCGVINHPFSDGLKPHIVLFPEYSIKFESADLIALFAALATSRQVLVGYGVRYGAIEEDGISDIDYSYRLVSSEITSQLFRKRNADGRQKMWPGYYNWPAINGFNLQLSICKDVKDPSVRAGLAQTGAGTDLIVVPIHMEGPQSVDDYVARLSKTLPGRRFLFIGQTGGVRGECVFGGGTSVWTGETPPRRLEFLPNTEDGLLVLDIFN